MKLKTLIILGLGVIGGIYLTTKEGEKAQKKIKNYTVTMKPVVKDLLNKTDALLDDVLNLKSDELRANIEKRVSDLKDSIIGIKMDDVSSATKIAIKEISNVLRKIRAEINLSPKASSKRMQYEKKSVSELRKIAKKRNIQLQPTDKKADMINKLVK